MSKFRLIIPYFQAWVGRVTPSTAWRVNNPSPTTLSQPDSTQQVRFLKASNHAEASYEPLLYESYLLKYFTRVNIREGF